MAIRPVDGLLCLETMRYADEIVPAAEIVPPLEEGHEPTARELQDGAPASWCPGWPPSSTRAAIRTPTGRSSSASSSARPRARRSWPGRRPRSRQGARPDGRARGQPRPGADGPRRRRGGGAVGEGERVAAPKAAATTKAPPAKRATVPKAATKRPAPAKKSGRAKKSADRPTGCPPAVGVRWLGRGLGGVDGVGSGRTTTITRGEARRGCSRTSRSPHTARRGRAPGARRRPRTIPLRGRARSRCRSRCRSCRPPLSWCGGRPPMVVWPRTPSPNHMSVIRRPGGLGRSNHGGVTATAR